MTFELLLELDYCSSLEDRYRLTQSRTSPVSSVDIRDTQGPHGACCSAASGVQCLHSVLGLQSTWQEVLKL